jgi:hypothetical protein
VNQVKAIPIASYRFIATFFMSRSAASPTPFVPHHIIL